MDDFFLLGYPLEHSLSPFIHARLFALSGMAANYALHAVPPEQFDADFTEISGKLTGCNVTTPYKCRVISHLDRLEGCAARYCSVNTVVFRNGEAIGYNTDAAGFLAALKDAGVPLAGRVLLLGSGGVARTFACEAALAGCEIVNAVREQSREKAEEIRRCALCLREVPYTVIGYGEIAGDFDLLINATTVGMYPHTDECLVPDEVLMHTKAVFDAVYNPTETALLRRAAACGAKTVGGMTMLVRQAAEAQTIWYGTRFSEQQLAAVTAAAEREGTLRRHNTTVLCGCMGSGKTTVGERLAAATGCRFVDLDAYIEGKAGMTVAEIFDRLGESAFRRVEAEACRQAASWTDTVIAAGGGTLVFAENAAALRQTCRIVLLDVSEEMALKRLSNTENRPLLQISDWEQTVHRLMVERRPAYLAAADLTVNADADAETVAAAMIQALQ